jgi:hypothetical protein
VVLRAAEESHLTRHILTITERPRGPVVDFQAGCWAESISSLELPASGARGAERGAAGAGAGDAAATAGLGAGPGSGDTDWTLGNRDDHGQYEAVFQAPRRGADCGGGDYQGAQWPGDQLSRSRHAPARSGCDGDWRPLPTDKPTYEERFGEGFEKTRLRRWTG